MIDTKRLYRKKALMIPRPQFIVLYNGTADIPEYQELKLSDLYLGELPEGEKSGFSKGEKSGFSKGEQAGEQKAALEIARNLKKSGISLDVIAKNTGLPVKK